MLLIHPPQVRNCEPPVALSRLAGALKAAGEEVCLLDGALEGFLWLTDQPPENPRDHQAKRVRRKKASLLTFPQQPSSLESYKKQVQDIKLLAASSRPVMRAGAQVTPADYQDASLSPLRSSDLRSSWEHPEKNLYYPWFSRRIADLLRDRKHRSAGISMGYLSQALTGLAICGYLKKNHPGIRVQLGGSLVTSWRKGTGTVAFLKDLADEISPGRGEEEIVRFCGRTYKGTGRPDFGELYHPPRGRDYLSPQRILPYAASLGCSWKRCTFCSETWEDNPYGEIPPERVSRDLTELIARHDPSLIHFCDSEMHPRLLEKLIDVPPGPGWYGFSRFLPAMTGPVYCNSLARSGCRMLCLGLESGDQKVLDRLRKGIRLDQVSRILKNLKDAGIRTYVYALFGTPAENREAAVRTKDFILSQADSIDYLNVSIFNMPIGSEEMPERKTGPFYEGDLALYTGFTHPDGWHRGQVRAFLNTEFRKEGDIKGILRRTPPVFTANHAVFLPLADPARL